MSFSHRLTGHPKIPPRSAVAAIIHVLCTRTLGCTSHIHGHKLYRAPRHFRGWGMDSIPATITSTEGYSYRQPRPSSQKLLHSIRRRCGCPGMGGNDKRHRYCMYTVKSTSSQVTKSLVSRLDSNGAESQWASTTATERHVRKTPPLHKLNNVLGERSTDKAGLPTQWPDSSFSARLHLCDFRVRPDLKASKP